MSPRRICVVTGSRAEYGLLRWLMEEIREDARLALQVVATGMHLAPEFGLTVRDIEQDGFTVARRVEMLLSSDTPAGITKSVGLGTIGFAQAFEELAPDIVVVLGDRFEILAAAQAAMLARIPLAHLHGGELSEGAVDDAIRHAITKMAHLHFVAAPTYRQRVIQMGESPERVFDFGAPGLDAIERLPLLERAALEESLGFKLGARNFLITYHPVTLGERPSSEGLRALFAALDDFPGVRLIFTRPNADSEGRALIALLDAWVEGNRERAAVFTSLGQLRYLSLLREVDAMIGNSSSGLTEAPALKRPSVNIGDRQKGRLRAASVIDCGEDAASIRAAISRALSPEFRAQAASATPVYGQGNASRRIRETLADVDLASLTQKHFHDFPHLP
ncbi:MAG: UDP-N-acetylglucosamine 2-epimerase [Betaproteobacteria bacterium]|nr:UDP-N-acetylglucosamine 2-epimerase [Betaproteobacteria bacterium]